MSQSVQYTIHQFEPTVLYVREYHLAVLTAADTFVSRLRAAAVTITNAPSQGWRVGQALRHIEALFEDMIDPVYAARPCSTAELKPRANLSLSGILRVLCDPTYNPLPASEAADNRYDLLTHAHAKQFTDLIEQWFNNGIVWLRNASFRAVFAEMPVDMFPVYDLVGDMYLAFVVRDRVDQPIMVWMICCYRVLSLLSDLSQSDHQALRFQWLRRNQGIAKKDNE